LPMAMLPGRRAMVKVGPPLFCKGPRRGSAAMAPLVIDPSSTMLFVDVTGWFPAKSPPLVLLAMMVLAMLRVPMLLMPPPLLDAELPERVELVRVMGVMAPMLWMPPPKVPAVLLAMVELVTERVPEL